MKRPLFANTKSDFVFRRIFGTEEHKPLLIALLNALLGLDEAHRIADITPLNTDQRIPVSEMKYSIIDITCRDVQGTTYAVKIQILNIKEFDKRIVHHVAEEYMPQMSQGQLPPDQGDVICVTICEFEVWPREEVPMLSRWRIPKDSKHLRDIPGLQFVFLELPKYTAGDTPESAVDKWTYFFREASNLKAVPAALSQSPFREALKAAKIATFTVDEWDVYIEEGIALQDKRGIISYAYKEGLEEGRCKGLRQSIEALCEALDITLTPERQHVMERSNSEELRAITHTIRAERRWP